MRWSGESRIPRRWICTGWIHYARWFQKPSRCILNKNLRKSVQRNITDFFKAWITTDSIKIFFITFCTLVTVYSTCKIAKDAFRFGLYVTNSYMQHCTVARLGLKQWWYLLSSWDVQCCMLLRDSVFVLWINKFKCSLKTSVSLVLATEHLKIQVES